MGSYKLYVAVMAIAIAVVQEVRCDWSAAEPYDEQEEASVELPMEHRQCDEYKSKIWDKAFSNQEAMQLMELTFNTGKELGSHEVCSDTTRAIFNFVDVMATNQNAHYSLGMMNKMLAFIIREVDTTSNKFKETKEVFERIAKTPEIRDYIKHTTARTVDLLKEPVIRGRLFKVVKAFEGLIKPSENEELVKQRLKRITNAPAKMAMGAINKFGSFLRRF
ncbi:uncharacterized protein LOC100167863 [Acyrthosiphon pisum]|uniref:Uncharacterized protein n=1 Tax=Acyrthosiphon pisum TaxID=7029 RepID=A0A8R1W1Y2_ACYPI|nr:uncharacterized protein LOC100167863 [Acyrthosiphon pisum]|eukprot:XP_001948358.2 PREDICTED: uncharacterized protein LOC100167863 [Acyrthosiphon pisum]